MDILRKRRQTAKDRLHQRRGDIDTGLRFRVCVQEQPIGFLLYGTRQGKEAGLRQPEI